MKRSWIFVLIILIGSCGVEENTPTTPPDAMFDPTNAMVLKEGMFTGTGGHSVSGTATLYDSDGTRTLVLNPFMSQNGPDLRVYISRDVNASSFISLGLLKSVNGNQHYTLPGGVNINEFTHVHIWCQQFSVEFGRAPLQ